MFERFEADARAAVTGARDASVRRGHAAVGSEDLLRELLAVPGVAREALTAAGVSGDRLPRGGVQPDAGLDGEALASIGIDLDAVRRATDAAFGPGALERAGEPGRERRVWGRGMTADARRVIGRTAHVAALRGDKQVSGGHMLLALIEEPDCPAAGALLAAGTDLRALRADVQRRLAPAA
jgi:ATP-dependent Clp protease ATP-binding subunit ClpA